MPSASRRRSALAWATYDWANSAFATTVVAGLFPAMLKDEWARDLPATESTLWLGVTLTSAGALVAISAPVLGGVADRAGRKKALLGTFAAVGMAATAALALLERGQWRAALVCYGIGYVGWLASLVFYDALLPAVADAGRLDRTSALGFALGYLGGGVLFALNAAWLSVPHVFGFSGREAAARASFVSVAVWWALFSIPLFVAVREPSSRSVPLREAARSGLREAAAALREVRRLPGAFPFLVAYWIYIDAVDTVITMAVDFGKAIGLGTPDLLAALLLVQLVGFPFAYAFGRAAERWGPRPMILAGLGAYVLITLGATTLSSEPWSVLGLRVPGFFVLAFAIGAVQGGVQALSRSLFARLVPSGREGALFGFYNMVGRFAAILGPVLVGVVGRITGEPRAGIASLSVLFVAGGALLARIRLPREAPRP